MHFFEDLSRNKVFKSNLILLILYLPVRHMIVISKMLTILTLFIFWNLLVLIGSIGTSTFANLVKKKQKVEDDVKYKVGTWHGKCGISFFRSSIFFPALSKVPKSGVLQSPVRQLTTTLNLTLNISCYLRVSIL